MEVTLIMTEVKTLSIPNPITALLNNYEITIERLYVFQKLLPEGDLLVNPLYSLAEEYFKALKYLSEEMYKDFSEDILPVEELLKEMTERLNDDTQI